MANNASLFTSMSKAKEENIFVADDYALIFKGCGKVNCKNGLITDVYAVPRFSANILLIPQLT
jgi:hypothetical protein